MTNYNNLNEQTKEIESLIASDLPKEIGRAHV